MGYFEDIMKEELKVQKRKLEKITSFLRNAPEGKVTARRRTKQVTYYQLINKKHTNINKDKVLVRKLIRKKIALKQQPNIAKNIKLLRELLYSYCTGDEKYILDHLVDWYGSALENDAKPSIKQNLEIYSPTTHVHETQAGIFVRSKSEVIIANTLHRYGIAFEYEKEFVVKDRHGIIMNRFYPDFTITLKDGRKIIWEHLGLLSNIEYCEKTVIKLNAFQEAGYLIGYNLLITMDNNKGSCNSQVIDKIIRKLILE